MSLLSVALPIFDGATIAWLAPVLTILMVILSVIMIIVVLSQDSDAEQMSAITGNNQSYFSQNKGITKEAMFKRATIGVAIAIIVLSMFMFLVMEL